MFPLSISARCFAALGILACTACAGLAPKPIASITTGPEVFYTVTAEIALSRHEARVAALQYAAAADSTKDSGLLQRATEVTADCLQPTLTEAVGARWIAAVPGAVDAHRAVGRAALEMYEIERSAAEYRVVLATSERGTDAEFDALETELGASDNAYGAREVADRLAGYFPNSLPALRLKALAALRADDPAAAALSFQAALAMSPGPATDTERRELTQGLWRAQILAGDVDPPLAEAKAALARAPSAENRLDYALLLLAAQQNAAARAELEVLAHDAPSKAAALRLLGLVDYQEGDLSEAASRFAELAAMGKFVDDSLYYLGMIAERHADLERALRLYAQVHNGENAVPALLRAASLLRQHGAAPAAEELLDELIDEEPQRAPELLVARARMYSTAGDMPQAVAVLEQAELEYPDNVELRYAMATMSEESGKYRVALHDLKAVVDLRPADPAALNAYGYTLADHSQKLGAARKLIEQAYAAAPKNAAILDSMGWVRFRQGHGDEALPFLQEAYADERDGDIAAHLGEVLWRLGQRADAERVWSEASRLDADNHLLKSTQSRLHSEN